MSEYKNFVRWWVKRRQRGVPGAGERNELAIKLSGCEMRAILALADRRGTDGKQSFSDPAK
jgi:hypothetical protein